MEPILHSYTYSVDYLREMVADISDELMTAQPDGIPNHPAWTIGHLVFISQEIGGVIGMEPWLDASWAEKFGPGSNPSNLSLGQHASSRATLNKADLLTALGTARSKLTNAVSRLADAELDATFPDPSYADVFPTVRHALTQVLLGHTAFHVGQISVWRRAMNLASIDRSYE